MMLKVKKNLLIHNDKKCFADSDKILDRDKHNEGANILQQKLFKSGFFLGKNQQPLACVLYQLNLHTSAS